MKKDELYVVLQEDEELSTKLAKNENGSVNGWERQWRDRMPSSTRMWRAVSEQKNDKSPCSSRCYSMRAAGCRHVVTLERLLIQ